MTISVTPNGDGTVTVGCGNESVTIGTPSSGASHAQPGSDDPTPVLWPNSGATAGLIAGGKAKTLVIQVRSANDLVAAIRSAHDQQAPPSEPTIYQFHVNGSEPVRVEQIDEVLSEIGNPPWLGTQIKLTGARNE